MTSMLDQYRSSLKRDGTSLQPSAPQSQQHALAGILSIRTTEPVPMFVTSRMKLVIKDDISHFAVCNNRMVILMANHLVRMGLVASAPPPEDVKPIPASYRVLRIFLDPSGSHLLMTVKSVGTASSGQAELWYLHWSMSEIRKCDRFRGNEVTAVAFNQANGSDASTGAILLGTSRGFIFETELSCLDDQRRTAQTNWKQVFDLGKGEQYPITGIQLLKVPQTMRHIVFVTTPTRLYKFVEDLRVEERTPYLHNIFIRYLNVPEQASDFHEITHKLGYSTLRFQMDVAIGFPRSYGWMTEALICGGQFDPAAKQLDCITSQNRIPLTTPANKNTGGNMSSDLITFVLTQFHAIVLYKDHVTAISLLDYQVEEIYREPHGQLVDICCDPRTNGVYMLSRKSIFRFKIKDEDRYVWRIYLNKNEFALAREYCKNPAQMDEILVKQAEQLFVKNDFLGAASVYSQTRASFESVCLRFLEIGQREALMVFLQSRFETLRASEKTQITMIIVLMVDLYLSEIAAHSVKNPSKSRQLQNELQMFLHLPRALKSIPEIRTVIYDLMASHGDTINLTALTTTNRDFEVVINQHINQSDFVEALAVLRAQNRAELFYKYIPVLMEELPSQTGAMLRDIKLWLDPERLLPALMCVSTETHRKVVIQYLEFSIQCNGCKCQAIHNYAIELYATYSQDKLMPYLENQGTDVLSVQYDVQRALRVCLQHSAKNASVFLQCLLGLWHPAVELALTFDRELAHNTASRPDSVALKRTLWLRIAEHAISGTDDVKMALSVLNQCEGLLRIEDVLPFFSDFERIDHFKETICNALKQYNSDINHQRSEMESSAAAADLVRAEIKTFRNQSVRISAQDKCNVCSANMLLRPFLIFPCGHKFHADCFEKQVDSYLPPEIQSQKKHPPTRMTADSVNLAESNGLSRTPRRDQQQTDYEKLANECVMCGHYMIESIDRPFVQNWDQVASDWL